VNVIGLDLSLTGTGIALADRTIHVQPKCRGVERLAYIRREVLDIVSLYDSVIPEPLLVAIEGYAYSQANQAHQMGELGGVIRLALFDADIPFTVVAPQTIKMYATGNGGAKEDAVLVEGVKRLGLEFGNDEMDAAWLRALVMDKAGEPIVTVPESHRRALDKVELPEGWGR